MSRMSAALSVLLFLLILPGFVSGGKKVKKEDKAVFAAGCFWCIEPAFDRLDGVIGVRVGYTGGTKKDPTYEEVCSGLTGHLEAAEITFDPSRIGYKQLLEVFWRNIDPTDAQGQFVDKGPQYRTAIFYHDEEQRKTAEASKKELEESGRYDKPVAVKILKAAPFYPAEEHHQNFYIKDPVRYKAYKLHSGREDFLERLRGEKKREKKNQEKKRAMPDKEELKKKLTDLQFKVTQECGTEPPFQNLYWNNKKEGIYVDIVSGEPLFSSLDKFDSGTGWPSFKRPLVKTNILEKKDTSHFMTRVEVKSREAGSHLGHVFNDGPAPGGLRYCINSAGLRFIPKEDLEKEGYAEFLGLFKK